MTDNPFQQSRSQSRRAYERSRLSIGTVVTAPTEEESSGLYHVQVRTDRYPDGTIARLQPNAHGDLYIPPSEIGGLQTGE